jgi:hypothetical protein
METATDQGVPAMRPDPVDLRERVAAAVDAVVELRKGTLDVSEEPRGGGEIDRIPEKRRESVPDYRKRQRAELWIASNRVEKYNDWAVSGRCKHQGMSWTPQGVLALAALVAARRNGEVDGWRRDRALPEGVLPEALRKVARARNGRTNWRAPRIKDRRAQGDREYETVLPRSLS